MRSQPRIWDPARGHAAYLGLGGNMGDRLGHLRLALFALASHPEIALTAVSRIYESEYVGPGRQAPYLNLCAEIRTLLHPCVLLTILQGIETRQGRRPNSHLDPRPIDLDILLYGDLTSADAELTLPHPGLRHRAFVLAPLAEIAPGLRIPDSFETVASACASIRVHPGPWVRVWGEDELLFETERGGEADWRAALAVHCR
jgi:2-amino-4-hydroxy-6-hydroxymethyldihydropteridine diphosphokinase